MKQFIVRQSHEWADALKFVGWWALVIAIVLYIFWQFGFFSPTVVTVYVTP